MQVLSRWLRAKYNREGAPKLTFVDRILWHYVVGVWCNLAHQPYYDWFQHTDGSQSYMCRRCHYWNMEKIK